ncbi:hypothetical protein [Nostoc sp.]
MGKQQRLTTQTLILLCFNTFRLKAQNSAREVLADTKNLRWAIHEPIT